MSTKLSLKDPNPGVWFSFDEDDSQAGEISLRPLNSTKRDEIRKKTISQREKFKHGQRYVIDETNEELFSEMVWDYSIVGWRNLIDDDGKDIECTTENKLFLMKNHIGFSMFVNEKMNSLAEDYEKQVTLEKKISLTGCCDSKILPSQVVKTAKA